MRQLLLILVATALVFAEARRAEAGILYSYQGATDPTTEGFAVVTILAPSTVGPLASDLGLPAWRITGSAQSSQYDYEAPGLTSSQQTDIASQGFTETLVARVLQNGLAPAYSSADPATIGGSWVGYAGVRWSIILGLNSNGDTVVVLSTTADNGGPGESIRSFGPSYTLTGSGSTYHTYQLEYNPVTHLADLSVDGTVVLTNYSGDTSFYGNSALTFGAASGGQANFNSVVVQTGLASVPEPSGFVLTAIGIVGLIGMARRRGRLAA